MNLRTETSNQFRRNFSQMVDGYLQEDYSVLLADGLLRFSKFGGGKPLVLLHGWTLDRRMWSPQHDLARDYTLIMPDRRGFGQSSADANLIGEYRDISTLIPEGKFALIGFSQGASVALDFACRYPDRVSALVLIGAPLHSMSDEDTESPVPLDRYRNWIGEGRISSMRKDWLGHRLVQSKPNTQKHVQNMIMDYQGRDLLYDSSRVEISDSDIETLPMPVLSVVGSLDSEWRRSVAHHIAKAAPKGEYSEIPNAGHLCTLDNSDAFNHALKTFLHSNNY